MLLYKNQWLLNSSKILFHGHVYSIILKKNNNNKMEEKLKTRCTVCDFWRFGNFFFVFKLGKLEISTKVQFIKINLHCTFDALVSKRRAVA